MYNQLMHHVIHRLFKSTTRLAIMTACLSQTAFCKVYRYIDLKGITHYSDEAIDPRSEKEDLLYCKIKGLTATGKRTSNGFIVFSGSQAVLAHRPSARGMRDKREQLIEKGLLVEKDGRLTFTKDVEFGSPSTAGSVVRGGNSNGLIVWKNADGLELKKIEAGQA